MNRKLVVGIVFVALGGLAGGLVACGGSQRVTTVVRGDGPMPVDRVVLFQNGMAYIERRAEVEGDHVELQTRASSIHDVLKSLAVVDHAGGAVTGVRVVDAGEGEATLRIGLAGEDRHDVSIAYVAEASGWRPTYRLVDRGDDEVRLQGLAVVDNPSGETWEAVRLALSTEVPLAFRYEVGTARVAERPVLDSNGRLAVRPIIADPSLVNVANPNDPGNVQIAYGMFNEMMPVGSQRAGRRVPNVVRNDEAPPQAPQQAQQAPQAPAAMMNTMQAMDAQDPADGFTLETPERLTLGAGESGLVPFVDQVVQGGRVLLYKPAPVTGGRPGASHQHPYHAVMFRNPLDAPLLTGPVTVYAEGSFQGDGVTGAIPARAHAFVAYALSPSISIAPRVERNEDEVRGLSAVGGRLEVQLRRIVEHRWGVTRHGGEDDLLYVYTPKVEGYEPEEPVPGSVVTDDGYFLPVPGDERAFTLVQRSRTTVDLSGDPEHAYVPALLSLMERSGVDVQPLRDIVNRLHAIRTERRVLDEDLNVHRRALEQRKDAMDALRNVPTNAALRRRLAQSIGEGVRAVDSLTRRIVEGDEETVGLRQDWYARLRALDITGS